MGRPEAKNEKYLHRRVKELGGEIRKVTWQGRRGAPDRLVMFEDYEVSCFVEVKADGEFPTGAQNREIDRLCRSGLFATWVNSVASIEQVLAALDSIALGNLGRGFLTKNPVNSAGEG